MTSALTMGDDGRRVKTEDGAKWPLLTYFFDVRLRLKNTRRQLLHEPTSPSCGLEGSARPRRGMRPARYAWRPASTAWRMAAAMRTGSSALATAVLRRTAAAPSSMAMTASDAG